MKLKEEFLVHRNGDETYLVPAGGGFAGLIRGNAVFGEILSLLAQDRSEAELIAALQARYETPEKPLARDVKKALETLRAVGALDE